MTASIRGLTIYQPFASLIVSGAKPIENRKWFPAEMVGHYIAIHAGAKVDADAWGGAMEIAREAHIIDSISILSGLEELIRAENHHDRFKLARRKDYVSKSVPYSAVLGAARLLGVASTREEAHRLAGGKAATWFVGPKGWVFDKIRKFQEPIECSGSQLLWELPKNVLVEVRKQWENSKNASTK